MVDKLILIIIAILSYMVFSNAISRERIMKSYIKSKKKTMLFIGISIVLFLIFSFILESAINVSSRIDMAVEGLFIGWTLALASKLQRADRAWHKKDL